MIAERFEMTFQKPWLAVDGERAKRLLDEIRAEVGAGHVLFHKDVTVIAERADCDDVLCKTHDADPPFVVVHLTWSHRREVDPTWPSARTFKSWEEWIELCMRPDGLGWEE